MQSKNLLPRFFKAFNIECLEIIIPRHFHFALTFMTTGGVFIGGVVGRSVGRLVGWSVGRLVGRSVGWSSKNFEK